MGYQEACDAAAERQGITTIVERLATEGITAEVEQTGGFTMVATITTEHGVVAITDDGEYAVGIYLAEAWTEGEEEAASRRAEGLDQMVADVREAVAWMAGERHEVLDGLAWTYRQAIEWGGWLDVDVPGGVVRVSPDFPDGVYGGFYPTQPDGDLAENPHEPTFVNGSGWDVTRIVHALRHPEEPHAQAILADYRDKGQR